MLGRPEQIPKVLTSISEATTVDYRVMLICSTGDTAAIKAAKASDADTMVVPWVPGRADFAKKINLAYTHVEEPWILQAATDLVFHQGWDDHAFRSARRAGVVGTNDLGNPLVKRGQHSTHTMFSRAYIDTYGGTVDGSGTVFSELYDHQYTDNEFVMTAIYRKQFHFARGAVIEHMHVHWGKSEMDATYEKATRETRQDRALYAQRARMVRSKVARTERLLRTQRAREARVLPRTRPRQR